MPEGTGLGELTQGLTFAIAGRYAGFEGFRELKEDFSTVEEKFLDLGKASKESAREQEAGLEKAAVAHEGFARRATKSLANVAIAGGALTLGVLFEGAKQAASVDDTARQVQVSYGIAGAAMKTFRGFVADNAAELGQKQQDMLGSIGKANRALQGWAGYSTRAVEAVTTGGAKLATMFNTNLGTATSAVTNQLRTFHIQAKDIPATLNLMARSAQLTGQGMNMFTGATGRALTAMAAAHLSFRSSMSLITAVQRDMPQLGPRAPGVLANLVTRLANPSTAMLHALPQYQGAMLNLRQQEGLVSRAVTAKQMTRAQGQAEDDQLKQQTMDYLRRQLNDLANINRFGVQGAIRNIIKATGGDKGQLTSAFGGGTAIVMAQRIAAMPTVRGMRPGDALNKGFDAAAKTTAFQFRKLSLQMEDIEIAIGRIGLPIMRQLLATIMPIVAVVQRWTQANPKLTAEIAKLIFIVAGLGAGIRALMIVEAMVKALNTWAQTSKVVAAVTALLRVETYKNIAAKIADKVMTLQIIGLYVLERIQKIASAAASGVMTAAQWALNAAMDANPIGLVVIALAALAAGFIYAYTHSKAFRDFLNGTWHLIQTVVGNVIDFLKNHWKSVLLGLLLGPFTAVYIALRLWGPTLQRFLAGLWTRLLADVKAFGASLLTWMQNAWTAVTNWLGANWKTILIAALTAIFLGPTSILFTTVFKHLPGQFLSWGRSALTGFISGISSMAGRLKDSLVNAVKTAMSSALSYVKGHNPFQWLKDHIPSFSLPFGGGGGLPSYVPSSSGPGGAFGPFGAYSANYISGNDQTMLASLGVRMRGGPIMDTDFPSGPAPVKLPGGKNAVYQLLSEYMDRNVGGVEVWRTPRGGTLAFLHLSQLTSQTSATGGQVVGVSGHPITTAFGNNPGFWHLCVVTDALGRSDVAWLSSVQMTQAANNGRAHIGGGGIPSIASADTRGLPVARYGSGQQITEGSTAVAGHRHKARRRTHTHGKSHTTTVHHSTDAVWGWGEHAIHEAGHAVAGAAHNITQTQIDALRGLQRGETGQWERLHLQWPGTNLAHESPQLRGDWLHAAERMNQLDRARRDQAARMAALRTGNWAQYNRIRQQDLLRLHQADAAARARYLHAGGWAVGSQYPGALGRTQLVHVVGHTDVVGARGVPRRQFHPNAAAYGKGMESPHAEHSLSAIAKGVEELVRATRAVHGKLELVASPRTHHDPNARRDRDARYSGGGDSMLDPV